MPFPANWPPPPVPGRGPTLRFFVEDVATANFSDKAYIFAQQAGANPLVPLPVVDPTFNPPPATLPGQLTADTDAVHGAVQESAANDFPGPFTSPDVPRNLTVTFAAGWQGGNVTVVGTDYQGLTISEVFVAAAGTTVVGTKIFKTVVSATKAASAGTTDTATIGVGTTSLQISNVPQNPAGTVSSTGYLFASTIRIVNDETGGGVTLEYSFDGTTVHGNLKPTEEFVYRGRYEAGIAVRGNGANYRIEAW